MGKRAQSGKLTKRTLQGLELINSLSPWILPETIEDAVQACKGLRIRYLWVDRLCIVQDDDRSKSYQIHAMGDIFASAKLVIIPADAEDMHSGVFGVSIPRLNKRKKLSSPVLDLVIVLPRLGDIVHWHEWRTRAWT